MAIDCLNLPVYAISILRSRIKEHDWKESGTLKLPPKAMLAKEGETYVYTLDAGTAAAKRYVVRYQTQPAPTIPGLPLGYVGDTSENKRSIGGSGHAIAFDRPADAKNLAAIQIYAGRYGLPQPPAEDFHVYVLDKDRKVLRDFTFPYAKIARSPMQWYALKLPPAEVPEHFYVALSFNPHETKGIYLGLDKTGKPSHSYVGLPEDGYEPLGEPSDWMVRAIMTTAPPEGGKAGKKTR